MDKKSHARLLESFRPSNEAELLANKLFDKGDLAGAEAACNRAIALSPKMRDGRPFALSVYYLLGEIRLTQHRNREALKFFLLTKPNFGSEKLNLSTTLAYCRVGDYNSALRSYEYAMNQGAREEWLTDNDPNRPGSSSTRSIEASILLARAKRFGVLEGDHGEADLLLAERLMPQNPMIANELGKVLRDNEKIAEATTRFKKAARFGRGELAKEAKRNAEGVELWIYQARKQKEIEQAQPQ